MALAPPSPDPSTLGIVSMSGGVDSSVAAARLLEQGYRVEGLGVEQLAALLARVG